MVRAWTIRFLVGVAALAVLAPAAVIGYRQLGCGSKDLEEGRVQEARTSLEHDSRISDDSLARLSALVERYALIEKETDRRTKLDARAETDLERRAVAGQIRSEQFSATFGALSPAALSERWPYATAAACGLPLLILLVLFAKGGRAWLSGFTAGHALEHSLMSIMLGGVGGFMLLMIGMLVVIQFERRNGPLESAALNKGIQYQVQNGCRRGLLDPEVGVLRQDARLSDATKALVEKAYATECRILTRQTILEAFETKSQADADWSEAGTAIVADRKHAAYDSFRSLSRSEQENGYPLLLTMLGSAAALAGIRRGLRKPVAA